MAGCVMVCVHSLISTSACAAVHLLALCIYARLYTARPFVVSPVISKCVHSDHATDQRHPSHAGGSFAYWLAAAMVVVLVLVAMDDWL